MLGEYLGIDTNRYHLSKIDKSLFSKLCDKSEAKPLVYLSKDLARYLFYGHFCHLVTELHCKLLS